MATASGVIGSIAVNIVAKTEQFLKGIKKAQRLANQFANSFGYIGAAIAAPMVAALRMFEATGSELHDMSIATGISAEQLSFLKYAAEQSGASLETITKAARELQTKGIDPNRFMEIAASIAAIKDPTLRAQAAFAKFGKKTGFPLLAMLKDLPQLKKRFEELGGTFTGAMSDGADQLGDRWGDLKLVASSLANTIGMTLKPMLISLTDFLIAQVKSIREWVAAHPKLTKAIFNTSLALAALIPIMWGINKAMKALTISIALLSLARMHPYIALAVAGGIGAFALYKYFKPPAKPEAENITLPSVTMPTVNGIAPGNAKIEQNTAAANDMLRQILEALKQQSGEPQQSQAPPVILSPAGAR